MAAVSATGILIQLSPRDYDAVLFDLDGVLTPTSSLHAAAWKQLFDELLRTRWRRTGDTFKPFDLGSDYPRYVDGKSRQDGVLSFLGTRGISLPLGDPDDAPGQDTVHALGHLKDAYFLKRLREHGVQPFEGAAELVRTLGCMRSEPPWSRPAKTARPCSKPPESPHFSIRAWTATTSSSSTSKASPHQMPF